MNIAKILFPVGAVASLFLAIATQNWWKLPIAALFILGYLQIVKAERKVAEGSEETDIK